MLKLKKIFVLYFFVMIYSFFGLSFCEKKPNTPEQEKFTGISEPLDPFEQNKLIGRSVNLGNALEAPTEGSWGVTLKEKYFQLIKDAGFNGVRIPIRWSTHAKIDSPYTINNSFFSRIDWAINQAFKNGLTVIINVHHYEEIFNEPEKHRARFLSLWKQISNHYLLYPKELLFEILNEPHNKLTSSLWNQFLDDAIKLVRKSNPNRTLVIGTANWGGISGLSDLVLPENDTNIIVTFHYYNPFHFTHQGAEWVTGSDRWLGIKWQGTVDEKDAVIQDINTAVSWANDKNVPLFMGEFGTYNKADDISRYTWTKFVSSEAEKRNISWAYWEFCSGFGVYDQTASDWNTLILQALIPNQ